MKRIFLIYILIIFVYNQEINDKELLQNSNFESLTGWNIPHKNYGKFFETPSYQIFNSENYIEFTPKVYTGLYQGVYNFEKKIISPLMFSYTFKANTNNVKLLGYFIINYEDGTNLPHWMIKSKNIQVNELDTECLLVPYTKPIKSVFVSFRVKKTNKKRYNF
jgi:hypothetical protein